MRYSKTAYFLLALYSLCIFQLEGFDVSSISKGQRVILALDQKNDWKPSDEELNKALTITQKYLEHPTSENEYSKGEIKSILSRDRGYRVQAWGSQVDGKKIIHLNFFPSAPTSGEDEFDYWKKEQVQVMDGGSAFWQVDVDLSSGKLIHFESNGYAALYKLSPAEI